VEKIIGFQIKKNGIYEYDCSTHVNMKHSVHT